MIAICLSTYNGSNFLPDFLASLEVQADQNWKLLVRDDSSTDDTVAIIQAFQTKNADRIEIILDGVNLGAKASFANLIEIALQNPEWEYLMLADQDDVWMEDKVAITLSKMEEMTKEFGITSPLLVHTDLSVVDSSLKILSESFWSYQRVDPSRNELHNQVIQNVVTGCTMMINRPLASLAFPIPKEAIMHDWWISLTASAFGHIATVNQPTILYRQHGANDTGAKNYGWRHIINRFASRPRLDKYMIQANAFYAHFGDQMNTQQREIFEDLSHWDDLGFWEKRRLIIKHRLWKNGFIRNIGLMVFA